MKALPKLRCDDLAGGSRTLKSRAMTHLGEGLSRPCYLSDVAAPRIHTLSSTTLNLPELAARVGHRVELKVREESERAWPEGWFEAIEGASEDPTFERAPQPELGRFDSATPGRIHALRAGVRRIRQPVAFDVTRGARIVRPGDSRVLHRIVTAQLRRASAVLVLALATGGCSKDPVLGADVDLSAAPATSSKPSASAPSPPVISRPLLTQQVVAGFPACVVDPPPRRQRIVGCKEVGRVLCWRYTERSRSIFDENDTVTEIRPSLVACLRPSLLPTSEVWAAIGILPSGRICAPSFLSNEALLPQSLACVARRLHAYRAPAADTSSALSFKVAIELGAPVVPRATPPQ